MNTAPTYHHKPACIPLEKWGFIQSARLATWDRDAATAKWLDTLPPWFREWQSECPRWTDGNWAFPTFHVPGMPKVYAELTWDGKVLDCRGWRVIAGKNGDMLRTLYKSLDAALQAAAEWEDGKEVEEGSEVSQSVCGMAS